MINVFKLFAFLCMSSDLLACLSANCLRFAYPAEASLRLWGVEAVRKIRRQSLAPSRGLSEPCRCSGSPSERHSVHTTTGHCS